MHISCRTPPILPQLPTHTEHFPQYLRIQPFLLFIPSFTQETNSPIKPSSRTMQCIRHWHKLLLAVLLLATLAKRAIAPSTNTPTTTGNGAAGQTSGPATTPSRPGRPQRVPAVTSKQRTTAGDTGGRIPGRASSLLNGADGNKATQPGLFGKR